jgi:hypothetical protein
MNKSAVKSLPAIEYLMNYGGPGFRYVRFGSLPLPSPLSHQKIVSLSQPSVCRPSNSLTGEVGEEMGLEKSQIIRSGESLAHDKSFNSLCFRLLFFYLRFT